MAGVRPTVGPSKIGVKIDLVAPGSRGLNLEQANVVLPWEWASEAQNAILDSNGRLTARALFINQTTAPIAGSPTIRTLFEQRRAAGTVDLIVAWDGGISTSAVNPAGSAVSGAVTVANGRWKFVNFNDKCIGFQAGQKLIIRSSGNFANVVETDGTAPQGGVGTAAYGRIWQVDADGHTIKYSGLLDETKWSTGGAGSVDMQTIWTDGTDVITAIATFNHNLVVFGKRHIILFNDGANSALGLNPTNMVVSDVITGTGCLSQFSVQPIGDSDLFFLSPTGVQSLQRLLVNRSNPLQQVTKYVRSALMFQIASEPDLAAITAVYSPANNFYLLALPSSGYVWVLDTKRRFQDEYGDDCCVITRWNTTLYALYETVGRLLYASRTAGQIAGYNFGAVSGEETTCRYIWRSPWEDFGQQQIGDYLKIMTRLGVQVLSPPGTAVILKWWTDFETDDLFGTATVIVTVGGTAAEYSIAEWNNAEFGGGSAVQQLTYDARATGQYFRFGAEADTSGTFSLQQSHIFAKRGRLLA